MDCHSNHSVFLRADGSLVCWDDAGSARTLQRYAREVDVSKDVVFGPVFSGIRGKLRAGEMPFPDVCKDCMVLASGACFNPLWAKKKEILIFQVEPSIACMLECPGCMTLAERKVRHGPPWNLDIDVLEKYLADFWNDGVSIRTIDFQGHGEPLINRKVWDMAGLAKRYFPEAKISMCTSAHGRFDVAQVHSGIDEVMFAIDGVDQASFEPNRVRGDFCKAYGYMKDFCHAVKAEGRHVHTIWKYILFDCNSAPEQLVRAQEMAAEADVNELLFVNTQLGLRLSQVHTLADISKADVDVKISLSNYLVNFHDVLHAVDKARFALSRAEAEAAGAHLMFAANMIRRRFECVGEGDTLPEEYQALIFEVLDLSGRDLIAREVRVQISGGFHRLIDKLTIGLAAAKDLVATWKSREIARLRAGLPMSRRRKALLAARSLVGGCAEIVDGLVGQGSLASKNRIIQRRSDEVVRLAQLTELQPDAANSVR